MEKPFKLATFSKELRLGRGFSALLFGFLLFGLFFTLNFAQAATTHYIRQGAVGLGNGSSWVDAFANIPSTFNRGDVYYVADGVYAGDHSLATAESGTQYINIKKATISEHGADAGWVSSYGDGTATFSGSLSITSGYWDFNGVTGGGPGSWTSGHGFVFTSVAGTNVQYFNLVGGISNIKIRHVYFNQTGNTENYSSGASAIYDAGDLNNSLFEYLYFDNLGALPFFLRNGSGNIIQYNYSGNICGMSVASVDEHCEMIVIHDMDDLQFRWNYIAESPSSGGFVKNNNQNSNLIRIYGNVFSDGFPIQCNTGSCSNWRIFNNTFHNFSGGPFGGDGAYSGLYFYNNLIYSASSLGSLRSAHDYNWFGRIAEGRCQSGGAVHENINVTYPSGCDSYLGSADPFVNSSGSTPESFKLSGAISTWPGMNVCSLDSCSGENKYNIDLFGNSRGADGVWDIGAFEYGSGATAPDAPTPKADSLSGASSAVVEQVTLAESKIVFGNNSFVSFSALEKDAYDKLLSQSGVVGQTVKQTIANFIKFGTPTTIILGSGERAGVIASFRSAFGYLPAQEADWQDVIKIANGRWTKKNSPTAENNAKARFKKIYSREPNMNQPNDNAAVNIMAYGLRPAQRNLNSEKVAINSFKYFYKKAPTSAQEWDIVRAIAYSGAKR